MRSRYQSHSFEKYASGWQRTPDDGYLEPESLQPFYEFALEMLWVQPISG